MQVEVVMPKMGESIQEGKILRWLKKPGDAIAKDETILEISTDKVDSEIPSPSAGILTKIVVPEQETVEVGTVIALIETDSAAAKVDKSAAQPVAATPASLASVATGAAPVSPVRPATEPSRHAVSDSGGDGARFISPVVRRIAMSEGVSQAELDKVTGSGIGGRVRKNDLLAYLKQRTTKPSAAPVPISLARVEMGDIVKKYPPPLHEVLQMDNIQQKMAEHMVKSIHTSPHVAAISECDVTRIVKFREKEAARFEKQEGYKLTFTPFFFDSAIRALKNFPLVNSAVEGDKIVVKKFINLGMAVAGPAGLMVPVIKRADEKSFLGLAASINDIALRTRNKKLLPDEIQGGTFTVTNYGVFGNIIGTPIISQPQVAILGIGAIAKRPVVVTDSDGNDSITIRSISYLTLSFDHRIIDGALGGQFLEEVVSNLENFQFENLF